MTLVSFKDAGEIADRFLALLKAHDIDPDPTVRSRIESELLSLTQLLTNVEHPASIGADAEKAIPVAAGLHDLAAKVLAVEGCTEFDQFLPHLRLIATAHHSASIIQTGERDGADHVVRLMTELYIGALVAHFGTDIQLDSPTAAKGDNPDVLFTIEETESGQRRRVGIAIKSITSKSGVTFYERIEDAARQIDSPRCNADLGLVLINATGALDHPTFWKQDFPSLSSATEELHRQLRQLVTNALDHAPNATHWDSLFQGKVVRPTLVMGQTVARLSTDNGPPTPTTIKALLVFEAMGEPSELGMNVACHLNHNMQTILFGKTGGQLTPPS